MAPKTPHSPFRGFLDVMSEMNRMQQHWMQKTDVGPGDEGHSPATAWVPAADIYAQSGDLVIRCELSGLKREDVDVTVSGGVLTISGTRHSELDESQVTYYARERAYGAFRRSMILPEAVDSGHVSASFDNGLLQITVKGGAAEKAHRIDIGTRNR